MKRAFFIASAAAAAVVPALPVKPVAASAVVLVKQFRLGPFLGPDVLHTYARIYEEHFLEAGALYAVATVDEECASINCTVQWPSAPGPSFIISLKAGSEIEITTA